MFSRANRSGTYGWTSRAIALACLAALAPAATDCSAEEPQPLAGQLYMSVFKRLPPGPNRDARQILVVDLESGRYEEVGAPGIEPRVSPDGKQVAYWTFGGENESFQAWIKELGRPDEPRLLSYGQIGGWVNGGRELILSDGHRPKDGNRWLYTNCRIDASGANRRDLKLPPVAHVVDCTADGKWLLVYGIVRYQLHVVSADGGQSKRASLALHRTFGGRFSPDGKQISYVVSAKPNRVVTVRLEDYDWHEVFRGKDLTEPEEVCWSPDGKHLAIVQFDWHLENGRRVLDSDHDANYRVLIVDADGNNPRPLLLEGLPLTEISGLDWKP